MRKPYSTDLSDAEWSCIEPHIPTPIAPGRPRVHPLREILNAIFYIVRSGCAWRLLPPTSLLGKPSTITSDLGGSTAPGKSCTPPCASGYESVWAEILNQAPASSTASQSRALV